LGAVVGGRGPEKGVTKKNGDENAPAHSIFCSPDGVFSVTVYAATRTVLPRAARAVRRAPTGREVRGARAKAISTGVGNLKGLGVGWEKKEE
jgi:hypothetical protein